MTGRPSRREIGRSLARQLPLLVGLVAFTLLTTWAKGRQLMIARLRGQPLP